MSLEILKIDYDNHKPVAQRFMSTMIEQLNDLILKNEITLGTQIEGRIKTFQSITEKASRKNRALQCVTDFDDYVGIRVIVLFKSDIDKTCALIKRHFSVVDEENVAERLDDNQFGYQSTHYTVKLPAAWLTVPTFAGLNSYKAEVQVRTLSQHIWAVASHKLQYKHESNVPTPVRRSINRVSALLETVDLEFERVLEDREVYLQHMDVGNEFNVDVIEVLCDRLLPSENKNVGYENYSEIFAELRVNGITDVDSFTQMIQDHLPAQIEEDKERVSFELSEPENEDLDRLERGVFFTHVGLVRGCLHSLKGSEYKKINYEEY